MRILCLIAMICIALASPAQAERYTLQYGAYSGGFQALDIALDFNVTAKNYQVTMNAKPYGMLGYILPWAGRYETVGHRKGAAFIPDKHLKISNWREDRDQSSFVYKNGALVSLRTVKTDNGVKRDEVQKPAPALHENATDIGSALVQMMTQVKTPQGCKGQYTVFDGKRRFALRFTAKGEERLSPTRWNSFDGPAQICEVEMIPLIGYNAAKPKGYYKIQEEARAKGQLPRLWLGQLWPNGPFVPVRMMVKYGYGAMLVHVQGVKR